MSASALTTFPHEESEPAERFPTPQPWNWTYDEGIRYEIANEGISLMIAHYSSELHKELQKTCADAERIKQIRAEMSRLGDERRNLHINDTAGVEAIIKKYAPTIKAEYATQP